MPGDLIGDKEDLLCGAKRILMSLTSLKEIYLKQFSVFGDPKRTNQKKDQDWLKMYRKNPKERVVTVGYLSLVKMEDYNPVASSFASDAEWVSLNSVPSNLAFDHNDIIKSALRYLKTVLDHKIVSNLLLSRLTYLIRALLVKA